MKKKKTRICQYLKSMKARLKKYILPPLLLLQSEINKKRQEIFFRLNDKKGMAIKVSFIVIELKFNLKIYNEFVKSQKTRPFLSVVVSVFI